MALPQLNDTPRYDVRIPSSGRRIRFRPYLVKEEKVLMVASSTEDVNQIMKTIIDTIIACTNGEVSEDELTTFDVEYLFLQLRSKSVGEKVDLNLPCDECEERTSVNVSLDDIECSGGNENKIIKLNDDIRVEMKYPSYSGIDYAADEDELGFAVLQQCLKTVITQDDRIDVSEEPPEVVRGFLESMTNEQFSKLTSFIEDMPQVKKDIEFTCEHCGASNSVEMRGMRSFF